VVALSLRATAVLWVLPWCGYLLWWGTGERKSQKFQGGGGEADEVPW